MRFEYLLIGFLVFSCMMVGGALIIGDWNTNYKDEGVNMSDEYFNDTYNTIDSMYSISEDSKEQVMEGDVDSGSTSWESMIRGGYSTIRLIPQSFTLFHSITTGLASTIGLNCNVTVGKAKTCLFIDAAFIAFSLTILFSVIYLVFQFIPR